MKRTYWFAARPADVEHHHPFLVFDRDDKLHFELTLFGKEAAKSVSEKTVQTYLHAILPLFSYLDTDEWQVRAGRKWGDAPPQVRQAVIDYLIQHQQCKLRQHALGFQLVSITAGTPSTVRVFLAGLRLFYYVMQRHGYYPFPNPLVDSHSMVVAQIEQQLEHDAGFPRMPNVSGVENPLAERYTSDSYFKLEDHTWVPQVVDDPTLFGRILEGGNLVQWELRELCVTRILFESGARISEVAGLTLGDWVARGMLQEANAFSKGSHGRRVKFLRFSSETAKLLRRYFDEERRKYDCSSYTLEDYLQLAKRHQLDLQSVPLFLSAQRTPLSAKTFRENFWKPTCQAAGLTVRVHQIRHWHVTLAVRHIHETATSEGEVQRRLQELVEYMKWKSRETLDAYEHYFDASRHAETLDSLHERMQVSLSLHLEKRKKLHSHKPTEKAKQPQSMSSLDEPDLDFLYHLGGE